MMASFLFRQSLGRCECRWSGIYLRISYLVVDLDISVNCRAKSECLYSYTKRRRTVTSARSQPGQGIAIVVIAGGGRFAMSMCQFLSLPDPFQACISSLK